MAKAVKGLPPQFDFTANFLLMKDSGLEPCSEQMMPTDLLPNGFLTRTCRIGYPTIFLLQNYRTTIMEVMKSWYHMS
jgi:hypothetical protein